MLINVIKSECNDNIQIYLPSSNFPHGSKNVDFDLEHSDCFLSVSIVEQYRLTTTKSPLTKIFL